MKDYQINNFTYKCSSIHYEINMDLIKYNTNNDFFKFLMECIQTKNYYTEIQSNIIILYNCNSLKKTLQNQLRVIIEKYRKTTIFIFITQKLSNIHSTIQSRCVCVRIPTLSLQCKISKLRQCTITNKNIKNKLYDLMNEFPTVEDINSLIHCTKAIKNGYKNPYEIIVNQIIILLNNKKLNYITIKKIKDISYNILKQNLNINFFYRYLLCDYICDPTYTFSIKTKLINYFATSNYHLIQSYKKIIHIESLLFNCHYIIHL